MKIKKILLCSLLFPITVNVNAQTSNNILKDTINNYKPDSVTKENIDKLKDVIKNLPENQKESLSEKYLYGENELLNNWHFTYGPLGNKTKFKTLKFFAKAGNGAAEFTCKNNGIVLLRYSLIQIKRPKENSVVNVKLSINGIEHLLPSVAVISKSNNYYVTYESTGLNVLGVLSAINGLVYSEGVGNTIIFSTENRELSLPTPNNNNNSKATLLLCSQWYNLSLENNKNLNLINQKENFDSIKEKINNDNSLKEKYIINNVNNNIKNNQNIH